MIDSYDRRVSETYMDEYFGDFLFDSFQPYHFYRGKEVDYVIPPEGELEDYRKFIEGLPLLNTPEVFGLHPNAEIGYFTQAAKEMWSNLIELQPQTGNHVTRLSLIMELINLSSERQSSIVHFYLTRIFLEEHKNTLTSLISVR